MTPGMESGDAQKTERGEQTPLGGFGDGGDGEVINAKTVVGTRCVEIVPTEPDGGAVVNGKAANAAIDRDPIG